MHKVILFDTDGVLTFRERNFSEMYIGKYGLKPQPILEFFTTEWRDFVTGKKDLKDHISTHPEVWQWSGTPQELLDYWFKSEDNRNEELLAVIRRLRAKGIQCYIVTEQEKYRTDYVINVMFKDEFDGYFSTCEIGYKKSDSRYFKAVLMGLRQEITDLRPDDIIYIDDSEDKLLAAREVGIDGELYTGPEQVSHLLS